MEAESLVFLWMMIADDLKSVLDGPVGAGKSEEFGEITELGVSEVAGWTWRQFRWFGGDRLFRGKQVIGRWSDRAIVVWRHFVGDNACWK